MSSKHILVTGGIGFIGSAITMKLLEIGHNVTVVDYDISPESFRIADILEDTAKQNSVEFFWCRKDLTHLSKNESIGTTDFYDAVIHCAAHKSIAMSLKDPVGFYKNNVNSTLNLLDWCNVRGIKRILFSSTAAVYDPELWFCFEEDYGHDTVYVSKGKSGSTTKNSDPYSGSKLICEQLLLDFNKLSGGRAVIFRYFNPIGSYKKLRTDISDSMFGNGFRAIENHEKFHIFGGDYLTEDGTCLRDYVDLRDIVDAHIAVLEHEHVETNRPIYNLGTGRMLSVLDCCHILKNEVPEFAWDVVERRPGDGVAGIANCDKVYRDYEWKSSYTVEQTVHDFLHE